MPEQRRALRIAMLAPPWLPTPPPGYGGIEHVVALLCDGLVRRGHDVTLFAAPGSASAATVHPVLPSCYPDRIERALHEVDHVARVFDAVDQAAITDTPFDLIHDHCGFTAFAMANRITTPVIHTLHGPFTPDTRDFYRQHAGKAPAIAISASQRAAAPANLHITAVIPNPIDVASWQTGLVKGDYVLWVGRMTAEKGPHRAIAAARAGGVPLILAGPIQPGQEHFYREHVEPHVNGSTVRYIGAVGGDTKQLLFAHARALLMPIRWAEPFGMVMIEALACGTPVIAFPEGAAPEVVDDGVTGFLVENEAQMAVAISQLRALNPADCRRAALNRYDISRVAEAYEGAYTKSLSTPRIGPARLSHVASTAAPLVS